MCSYRSCGGRSVGARDKSLLASVSTDGELDKIWLDNESCITIDF